MAYIAIRYGPMTLKPGSEDAGCALLVFLGAGSTPAARSLWLPRCVTAEIVWR